MNFSNTNHPNKEKETVQSRLRIGFAKDKNSWKNSPAIFNKDSLKIQGHPVMERWEEPYMQELARIATSRGGVILEIGFGMGIAATFIDKGPITKHIIIEANHSVAQKARIFAKQARVTTQVIEDFAENVLNKLSPNSFEGVLSDVYPLTAAEIHQDNHKFFKQIYQKLKPGGVFTYFSDEIHDYSPEHLDKLLAAGFSHENIKGKVVSVNPPPNCLYWRHCTILAPIIIK